MKLIFWEQYKQLDEETRRAVNHFDKVSQQLKTQNVRLKTFLPAALVVVMSPLIWEYFGKQYVDNAALNEVAQASLVYSVMGSFIIIGYALGQTLAILRKHIVCKLIKRRYNIDVSGVDLMEMQMEYERRTNGAPA